MPRKKDPIQIDFKVCVIEEQKPLKTHVVLKREVLNGRKILYISRKVKSVAEEQFKPHHRKIDFHRITPRRAEDTISQLNEYSLFCDIDNYLNYNYNPIIAISNFEIFCKWQLFDKAFEQLERVLKLTRIYECAVMLVIDPSYFTEEQMEKIESLADKVIPPSTHIEIGSRLDRINSPLMKKYHEVCRKFKAGEFVGIYVSDAYIDKMMRVKKARDEILNKNKKAEEEVPQPL